MGKNVAKKVVLHGSPAPGSAGPAGELNAFYVEVVERRLGEWNLTKEQKLAVLDRLVAALKEREKPGGK